MSACIRPSRPHYPTSEQAAEHGTPEWCESCRRWAYIPTPRVKLPRCDAGPHFTYASGASRWIEQNPGVVITPCACGGLFVPLRAAATPIEPPEPPAPRKLDLEAAQRSCFSKKAYPFELANKIATERGLRVYSCVVCGRYHLTKTALRSYAK